MTRRRFTNPVVSRYGRIGHPAGLDRNFVRCAGVAFFDDKLKRKWTFRRYEAYQDKWPEVDVWTVQEHQPARRPGGPTSFGLTERVEEADVPSEVREFALAEMVRLRLQGRIDT